MKTSLSVLSLAALLAGTPVIASEHDPLALAQGLADAWDEAFNTGDAAGIAATYAEDARVSPGNGGIVEGRAAIQELFQGFIDYGAHDHVFEIVDATIEGDVLYIIGRWQVTGPEQDGEAPVFSGALSNVFHKDADGNWLSRVHIWNNSPE